MHEDSSAKHGCILHSLLITKALFNKVLECKDVRGPLSSTQAEHSWESPITDTTFPQRTDRRLKATEPQHTRLFMPQLLAVVKRRPTPSQKLLLTSYCPSRIQASEEGLLLFHRQPPLKRREENGRVTLSFSIHLKPHHPNHK